MVAGESCWGFLGIEEVVTSPVAQLTSELISWSHGSPKIRFSCPQFTTKNSLFSSVLAIGRWGVIVWQMAPPWLAFPSTFCALNGWESLCIWYPFLLIKSQSIQSPIAPLLTRAKVSMICAPSFTKMKMWTWMDFSSGSDTNIGAIISGGNNLDTFLQSKNPWLPQS